MNDVTIAKCHCCGQEMNPSDHNDRLRAEVASLTTAAERLGETSAYWAGEARELLKQLAAANGRVERMREALEKVNRSYLESTHSDDHGYVEIFTDATHAAVEAALSDLPEADKEKS